MIIIFLLSLSTPFWQSLRIGLGLTLVFYVPGLLWTYIFWPVSGRLMNASADGNRTAVQSDTFPFIHRVIFSFLLSMVVIPIGLLIGNRFHAPIVTGTIYYVSLTIIVAGAFVLGLQHRRPGAAKS